jgi:hypothetical protein
VVAEGRRGLPAGPNEHALDRRQLADAAPARDDDVRLTGDGLLGRDAHTFDVQVGIHVFGASQ